HGDSFRGRRRCTAAPSVGWLGAIMAQIGEEDNGCTEMGGWNFLVGSASSRTLTMGGHVTPEAMTYGFAQVPNVSVLWYTLLQEGSVATQPPVQSQHGNGCVPLL
ncbi:MAG: hypothetical protein ACK47M_24585, partial [Caldilinea sp.]